MAESSHTSVYPAIFGVEEELWLTMQRNGEQPRPIPGPVLEAALADYQELGGLLLPHQGPPLQYESSQEIPSERQFNSAGDRTYIDGRLAERSIAETSSVREAIIRSRGVEQFAASIGSVLLQSDAGIKRIIHNRRVGWQWDDYVGAHDSVYAPEPPGGDERHAARIELMLEGMLLTRPYLTGAGSYHAGSFSFSQKLDALSRSPYPADQKLVQFHAAWGRAEVRQNDINICDEAAMIRLGEAAIGAAIAQTPLFDMFVDMLSNIRTLVAERGRFWHYNVPVFDPDGQFAPGRNVPIMSAAELHMWLAEAFTSNGMRRAAGDQPEELLSIAELIYDTSETMLRVLRGNETLAALERGSDWVPGLVRTLRGEPVDYDTSTIVRGSNGPVWETPGLGFHLRDNGTFRGGIGQADVDAAYCTAPANTRAAIRAEVITKYVTKNVFWERIELQGFDANGDPEVITVRTDDPLSTELPLAERSKLRYALPVQGVAKTEKITGTHGGPSPSRKSQDAVTKAIYKVIDATTNQDPA